MKYQIRKCFYHKNVVMLLSVVPTLTGTSAMWSTHKWESDVKVMLPQLIAMYQKDHDRQIDDMIIKEYVNEPEEFKHKTIMDQTKEILQ